MPQHMEILFADHDHNVQSFEYNNRVNNFKVIDFKDAPVSAPQKWHHPDGKAIVLYP